MEIDGYMTKLVLAVGLLTLVATIAGSGAVLADDPQNLVTENITITVTDSTGETDSENVSINIAGTIPDNAVYDEGSAAATYDTDGDGLIDIDELAAAGADYSSGEIGIDQLANIGRAYSSS